MKRLFDAVPEAVLGILLMLIILACTSCDSKPDIPTSRASEWGWDVDTIQGCEYLSHHASSRQGFTHKGNCTNPIHHYQNPDYAGKSNIRRTDGD